MSGKKKHNVLVVDDEASVLFTYKLLLEQQGYAVAAVPTSAAAKAELKKASFDLLLCDLSLEEDHNGFEVIEYARESNAAIACVLLTGYASIEAAQKAVKEYGKAINAYVACIKLERNDAVTKLAPKPGDKPTPEQKKATEDLMRVEVQKHNAAIDQLQSVADRFNEQVKVYKAKSADKSKG